MLIRQSVRRVSRPGFALCVLCLLTACSATGIAQDYVSEGKDSLDRGEFEAARKHFLDGLNAAEDPKVGARFEFYLGLCWQRQYEKAKNDGKLEWLTLSKGHYEKASTALTKSAGTWNNLGQVAAKLGDKKTAMRAFRNAIPLAGRAQPAYMVNYAEFLTDTGDVRAATRFYKVVLEQQPGNARAHTGLLRINSDLASNQKDGQPLVDYVWSLYDAGQLDAAVSAAISSLDNPFVNSPSVGRNANHSKQLLSCIVKCLSEKRYAPEAFEQLRIAHQLHQFRSHRVVGQGVEEVFLIHHLTKQSFEKGDLKGRLKWWSGTVPEFLEKVARPHRGWPQESFTSLIRSIGEKHERRQNRELAEKYYRLAFGLTQHYHDPNALLKLADMWIGHKDVSEFRDVISHEGMRILEETSEVNSNAGLQHAYEFHRALGTVYAHLNQWDESGTAPWQNATYQITELIKKAKRLNYLALEKGDPARFSDVDLIDQLAQQYLKDGKLLASIRLRVEQADYFRSIDLTDAATEVFQPISKERPAVNDKKLMETYDKLFDSFRPLNNFKPSKDPFHRINKMIRPDGNKRARVEITWPKGKKPSEKEQIDAINYLQDVLRDLPKEKLTQEGTYQFLSENAPNSVERFQLRDGEGAVWLGGAKSPEKLQFKIKETTGISKHPVRLLRP